MADVGALDLVSLFAAAGSARLLGRKSGIVSKIS
jgi:hypothetical protein